MPAFADLPKELQGCCTSYLDTKSAASFAEVSSACKELVHVKLDAAKEQARLDAPYNKFAERYGEMLHSMCCGPDPNKLITFSDGGAKVFKCTCNPDKEFPVGTAYTNLALHLASRRHLALGRLW